MSVHGSSTDLAVVPHTGEVLNLHEQPTERLAAIRDQLVGLENEQRDFKRAVDTELHSRLDYEGTLTLRVDGWEIKGKPPTRTEWNVEQLRKALEALVDNGDISEVAAHKALEPVLELKPRAAGLNALLKQKGPVADAVEACRCEVAQDRRATVKRAS